jgi:hypothetical protein
LFYVPELGFNIYDGALLSLSVNNKSLLDKPFVFEVSPTYSFNTKSLTGSGGVFINKYNRNSNLFNTVYGISGSYFHYIEDASYLKINPTLQFKFRDNNFRDNKRQYLTFRQIIVDKEAPPVIAIPNALIDDSPLNYSVFDARYNYIDSEMSRGLVMGGDIQFANNFGKISTEVSYRKLFENNIELGLRLYAGTFLYKNTPSEYYSFGLDRPKDYLFDYSFYGRSESTGFFSQEIIIAEGGFKSKFQNPYANKWITAFNLNTSIWRWIQIYGDVGFYQNKGKSPSFVYDSGIHLNFVPGYFELFFPVQSTNGFELAQKNYSEKIRFIFALSTRTLIGLFTRKWF